MWRSKIEPAKMYMEGIKKCFFLSENQDSRILSGFKIHTDYLRI